MLSGYLILFGSAFLAATLLPFYSEVILIGMLAKGADPWIAVLVASLGNTLGALVNYVLGRYLLHYQDRRWFYVKPHQLESTQRWFQRYGSWSLLFAWLPIGGDALTFIAGVMKVRMDVFLLLVGLGKFLRYLVVAGLADQIAALLA